MDWNNLVYLDLFSGVGGFTHGILEAGVKFKQHYFSEIDKHSIAVYKYHYEKAQAVGNIVSFSGDGIERPNLITFGFPCQDISIAGNRACLAGSRSGLFFQALRLIQKFKPEIFIFENVAGLLSSNDGKDFEVVLRAIADLGLYECQWQLVNTRWLLPQNRERVYFVGCLGGTGRARVFPFREGDKEFDGHRGAGDGVVSASIDSNYWKGADGKRTMINVIGNVGNGHEVDNIHSPDGLAPTVRDNHGKITIVSHYGHKDKPPVESEEVPTLKAESHGHEPMIIQKSQDYREDRSLRTFDDCPTLRSEMGDNAPMIIDMKTAGGKSATRRGGVKQDESPTLDQNCNLAVANRLSDYQGDIITDANAEYHPTIPANGGNKLHGVGIRDHQSAIRRLTPVECERLQGFPDSWTAFGNYDGIVKPVPKTQRYRQMGNAVTTLWPKLIMQRLIQSL